VWVAWVVPELLSLQGRNDRRRTDERDAEIVTTRNEKDKEHIHEVEIGSLTPRDVAEAMGVLARGMRDNPNHVAAFGDDPSLRLARLRRFFERLNTMARWEALVARNGEGTILGVLAVTKPGRCGLPSVRGAGALSRYRGDNPEASRRIERWLEAWRERDPKERHWHLGPFAIEAGLRGKGIGSELLRVFCAQMDAGDENAYVETDTSQSVRFCERFGFEVVGEGSVLGATNWFMIRRPHTQGEDR
jgi:ribosomal protein S18 acetylase RimI-like enzyme